MSLVTAPLLGYAPDLDPAQPGVFSYCNGMEPTKRGWRIQRALASAYSTSSASFASGSYLIDGLVSELPDGTEVIHQAIYDKTADKTKLYALIGSTMTDKSRGSNYTKPNTTTALNFSFCQYGNYTIATNLTDVLQIRDASGSSAFADSVATGIPKAKIAVTWGPPTSQRVMLFHFNDGTDYPDGWWSSHQGGPTASWVTDVATGAANGRLTGAGPIRCGVAYGDDIIAFSDRQMWFGRFVGPPFIVKWTRIASDVGCCGPYAAKVINGVLYWVGMQGVFAWAGSGIQKLDIPVQREVAQRVFAASTFARYVQLTGDATTRRLMIAIRTNAQAATSQMTYWYSINLDNNQVGFLTSSRNSAAHIFSNAYDRNKAAAIVSGESVVFSEGAGPYLASVSEGVGFGLHYGGSNKGDTKLRGVIPRFIVAPTSYRMTDYYGPTFSEVSNAATAIDVSASPWRADIIKAANWHAPRLYLATSSPDVEVADALLDIESAGNR